MRYSYEKYRNLETFLNPSHLNTSKELFSIPLSNNCKGLEEKDGDISFTSKCFKCNFCAFGDLKDKYKEFTNSSIDDSYFFKGALINLPNTTKLNNPINNLEVLTEKGERSRIQKWEMGILKNILGDNFKTSEEIPIPSDSNDRPGRVDIGIYNKNNEVVLVETKTTLEDALNDERFVDQFHKYHNAISMSEFDGKSLLCLSIGGKESDLLPPSIDGILDTGFKKTRLYQLLQNEGSRIPLISAAAFWCLSTMYINGNLSNVTELLFDVFSNNSNIALLSGGIVRLNSHNNYEIIPLSY